MCQYIFYKKTEKIAINKVIAARRRMKMMSGFQIRTDLALEAKENCEAEHETIRGVKKWEAGKQGGRNLYDDCDD